MGEVVAPHFGSAAISLDMKDLPRLRARSDTFKVGVFCGFDFGLLPPLDSALFLFLLLLFSRTFSDSFFQLGSLLTNSQSAGVDEGKQSPRR
jgi:hypothetical protein